MIRTLLFVAILIVGIAFLYDWLKKRESQQSEKDKTPKKAYKKYQAKINPQEPWVEIFETAEREEVTRLKVRLEEEDINVILIEQGKKDLQGNVPPGISLAVPKSHAQSAQNLICRYLEHN